MAQRSLQTALSSGVGDIFAVGLGLLRVNIAITAISVLAGKNLRYAIWGWLKGLVF